MKNTLNPRDSFTICTEHCLQYKILLSGSELSLTSVLESLSSNILQWKSKSKSHYRYTDNERSVCNYNTFQKQLYVVCIKSVLINLSEHCMKLF